MSAAEIELEDYALAAPSVDEIGGVGKQQPEFLFLTSDPLRSLAPDTIDSARRNIAEYVARSEGGASELRDLLEMLAISPADERALAAEA